MHAAMLTRYERARALSHRVVDLEGGAPPLLQMLPGEKLLDLARRELDANLLPYEVVRVLPSGQSSALPLGPALSRLAEGPADPLGQQGDVPQVLPRRARVRPRRG